MKRYKEAGRRIIVGEVTWADGAEAIWGKGRDALKWLRGILKTVRGRRATDDRKYLENIQESTYLCGYIRKLCIISYQNILGFA